ncbi:aminopeptidase [Clostridium chauvoei]|uniref:M18 family aminopeptidase n=2 Tax=Clostridium chauvoei TaxID=46867 RepID=S6ESI6_9CLOT|nr:aminopeptidase [Clostridium chauvoei]ATD55476.1 aminopeptidase [Clostridium chauvoei]ATD56850.1 aminopeptidase [Clostridium chauvoei]MBX7280691.1 aminopeptidase [Clostridium chauvoei]MBX7283175.1 aminopeptidase [Clostridium chauvoei]MBX7285732.1 aminopeptidase [Clostridium chauvoei]
MSEKLKSKNAWLKYNSEEKKQIFEFCTGYIDYMSVCKTERECVLTAIDMVEAMGYRDLEEVIAKGEALKAGDKVFMNNKDKSLAIFLIGKEPIEKGMRILGSHVDSPRLDLKQNPLYEDSELAMLDTHYYGGVKKYQWVTLPLAIHGVVVKKDGSKIDIVIGEDDKDPVIGVSDLLIHLAGDQLQKKGSNVIEGEDLNILVGNMPLEGENKDAVKANILKLIKEKYDFEEEDFLSAELEVVPAGRAREFGLDRSMVMAYGQDDRICAYTSLMALLEVEEADYTSVVLLVDKEEVGSNGATGMHSKFFENVVAEIMDRTGEYSELKLRRALANSKMLSADVTAAYDPNYPSVLEKKNSSYFGRGLVFSKYTGARGKSGCNDANAEFMAWLRKVMDNNNVSFQTAELGKVDQGGGGTIAYILAQYNMEVIDCGVALQNMHAPWEVSSKVDIYETKNGYKAFLEAK